MGKCNFSQLLVERNFNNLHDAVVFRSGDYNYKVVNFSK